MSPLVDTTVLSELSRAEPNPGVLAWAATVQELWISVVTVEEIRFGLAWRPNPRVQTWFDRFLREQVEVLPITESIASQAGHLRGSLRARGEQRTQADLLIAATALAHGLVVVTRNTRDFASTGVAVLDPFR
jgi:predicted nucleic acid-binding protein